MCSISRGKDGLCGGEGRTLPMRCDHFYAIVVKISVSVQDMSWAGCEGGRYGLNAEASG